MNGTLGKIVPTLVVLGVALYCGWPESAAPRPPLKDSKKASASPGRLSPAAFPPPERDPCETAAPTQAPAKAVAEAPPAAVSRGEDFATRVKRLALKATFLSGERRLALINGHFYAEGDYLPAFKDAAAVLVAQVEADRVVLSHDGRTAELKYPEKEGKRSSSGSRLRVSGKSANPQAGKTQ